MKEKAANSNEQPRKIVQNATATLTSEDAVALPKCESLTRSIQRQRRWGKNYIEGCGYSIGATIDITRREIPSPRLVPMIRKNF